MNFVLVDTSVVVDLWRGKGAISAMSQLGSAVKGMSLVTVGELRHGLLRRPLNQANTASFLNTLNAYLVVPIDSETAEHWARLRHKTDSAGKHKNDNDLWIAATSLRLECPVASLDSDFVEVPEIRLIGADGVEQQN